MTLCGYGAELERLLGRLPRTYLKRQDADWCQLLPLLDGEERVLYPQHLHHERNQGVAGKLGRRMDQCISSSHRCSTEVVQDRVAE